MNTLHEASGGLYEEIQNAAGLYGVFEDLFDGAYFTPNVNLEIEFDYEEDLVTPVFRYSVGHKSIPPYNKHITKWLF